MRIEIKFYNEEKLLQDANRMNMSSTEYVNKLVEFFNDDKLLQDAKKMRLSPIDYLKYLVDIMVIAIPEKIVIHPPAPVTRDIIPPPKGPIGGGDWVKNY